MRASEKIVKIIFGFIFLMFSCTPKDLRPGDYVAWIEAPKHGLLKEKQIGNIIFKSQYKPYEYVVLKEGGLSSLNEQTMKEQLSHMGDLLYFTLRIQTVDGSDPLKFKVNAKEEYYSRIKYLSFDVQNDMKLLAGKDTIKCAISVYDRSFGLKPELTILAGFPLKDLNSKDDIKFMYTDKIFNSGPVILSFERSDITELPNLKL